jgi:uncharacterized membrane protein
LLKTALIVLLVALYALASHFALILPSGQTIAAALAIVVPAAAVMGVIFQWVSQRLAQKAAKPKPSFLQRVVAAGSALLLLGVPLWWVWPLILHNADALYFAQHLGMNALLAWVFGHTLLAGHTPLVVTFARMVHRQLPPAIEAYARRVTGAWTIFFVATCALSIILFFWAPLVAWSTFAVLLQWPSVAVFFVGEYLLRRILFRNFDHASLQQGLEAYRQNQSQNYSPLGDKPHP